jgi:hypothetical protein
VVYLIGDPEVYDPERLLAPSEEQLGAGLVEGEAGLGVGVGFEGTARDQPSVETSGFVALDGTLPQ